LAAGTPVRLAATVRGLSQGAGAARKGVRRAAQWERVYNTVRPHQALGYRTPREFLRDLFRAGNPQCVTDVLDEYNDLTSHPRRGHDPRTSPAASCVSSNRSIYGRCSMAAAKRP
jgi:hypothetical protein